MQAKRFFGLVSSAFLVLVGPACGDDDEDSSKAITAFSKDYCQLREGVCCTQSGKTYDASSCETLLVFAGTSSSVAFDQASADACLAGLRAAQSSASFCSDHGGPEVAKKCNDVYKSTGGSGTTAPGGTCKSDSECAAVANGTAECVFSADIESDTRVCQAHLRGSAGADCAGERIQGASGTLTTTTSKEPTITVCWEEDNLYCKSDTKKCTSRGAIGDKCSNSDYKSCPENAYCARVSDTSTEYHCVALGKVDEPCDYYAGSSCEAGLHCNQAQKKCETDTPVGGACDPQVPSCGKSAECTGGVCKASSFGFSLFCK